MRLVDIDSMGVSMKQFINVLGIVACALCQCAQAGENESVNTEAKPGVVDKVEHAVKHGAKVTVSSIEHGGKAAAHGLQRGGVAVAHGIDVGVKATAKMTHQVVDKLDGNKENKSSESEK